MFCEIRHPRTSDEALAWLQASPIPFDSPTHHRYRTREHLDRVFAAGRRHPDWVWGAHRDGEVVATLAALSFGSGVVLDHLSDGPPEALESLLATATAATSRLPEAEVGLFLPPGASARGLGAAWTTRLEACGWRLVVERHHYEFAPHPGLRLHDPEPLELRRAESIEAVRPVHAEVMRDTLDAHDRELIAHVGLTEATQRALAMLLEADPLECIRLAHVPGNPTPVGMVSWLLADDQTGHLSFVGVPIHARGHGYGRRLVAAATRALLTEGATTLVADTDHTNTPMAAAFAAVGWPVTEVRADFALSRGAHRKLSVDLLHTTA